MLFDACTLEGLTEGRVDRTFRRWKVVRRGGRPVHHPRRRGRGDLHRARSTKTDLTEADAFAAGFATAMPCCAGPPLRARASSTGSGSRWPGPIRGSALRSTGRLDDTEIAALTAQLDRMDRAAESPWTRRVLRQIRRYPGVVSTELAAEAGQERAAYKLRVRRLKALGLTESLETGYLLSPRGAASCERSTECGSALCDRFTSLLEWLLFAGFLHGTARELGSGVSQTYSGDSAASGRRGKGIPDATVARLPVYLRALNQLAEHGIDTVSSGALAEAAGSTPPSSARTCPTSARTAPAASATTCSICSVRSAGRWDRPTTGR